MRQSHYREKMQPFTSSWHCCLGLGVWFLALGSLGIANDGTDSWVDLSSGEKALGAWASPTGDWFCAASAKPDSKNPRMLQAEPGQGILVNGRKGRTVDLITK